MAHRNLTHKIVTPVGIFGNKLPGDAITRFQKDFSAKDVSQAEVKLPDQSIPYRSVGQDYASYYLENGKLDLWPDEQQTVILQYADLEDLLQVKAILKWVKQNNAAPKKMELLFPSCAPETSVRTSSPLRQLTPPPPARLPPVSLFLTSSRSSLSSTPPPLPPIECKPKEPDGDKEKETKEDKRLTSQTIFEVFYKKNEDAIRKRIIDKYIHNCDAVTDFDQVIDAFIQFIPPSYLISLAQKDREVALAIVKYPSVFFSSLSQGQQKIEILNIYNKRHPHSALKIDREGFIVRTSSPPHDLELALNVIAQGVTGRTELQDLATTSSLAAFLPPSESKETKYESKRGETVIQAQEEIVAKNIKFLVRGKGPSTRYFGPQFTTRVDCIQNMTTEQLVFIAKNFSSARIRANDEQDHFCKLISKNYRALRGAVRSEQCGVMPVLKLAGHDGDIDQPEFAERMVKSKIFHDHDNELEVSLFQPVVSHLAKVNGSTFIKKWLSSWSIKAVFSKLTLKIKNIWAQNKSKDEGYAAACKVMNSQAVVEQMNLSVRDIQNLVFIENPPPEICRRLIVTKRYWEIVKEYSTPNPTGLFRKHPLYLMRWHFGADYERAMRLYFVDLFLDRAFHAKDKTFAGDRGNYGNARADFKKYSLAQMATFFVKQPAYIQCLLKEKHPLHPKLVSLIMIMMTELGKQGTDHLNSDELICVSKLLALALKIEQKITSFSSVSKLKTTAMESKDISSSSMQVTATESKDISSVDLNSESAEANLIIEISKWNEENIQRIFRPSKGFRNALIVRKILDITCSWIKHAFSNKTFSYESIINILTYFYNNGYGKKLIIDFLVKLECRELGKLLRNKKLHILVTTNPDFSEIYLKYLFNRFLEVKNPHNITKILNIIYDFYITGNNTIKIKHFLSSLKPEQLKSLLTTTKWVDLLIKDIELRNVFLRDCEYRKVLLCQTMKIEHKADVSGSKVQERGLLAKAIRENKKEAAPKITHDPLSSRLLIILKADFLHWLKSIKSSGYPKKEGKEEKRDVVLDSDILNIYQEINFIEYLLAKENDLNGDFAKTLVSNEMHLIGIWQQPKHHMLVVNLIIEYMKPDFDSIQQWLAHANPHLRELAIKVCEYKADIFDNFQDENFSLEKKPMLYDSLRKLWLKNLLARRVLINLMNEASAMPVGAKLIPKDKDKDKDKTVWADEELDDEKTTNKHNLGLSSNAVAIRRGLFTEEFILEVAKLHFSERIIDKSKEVVVEEKETKGTSLKHDTSVAKYPPIPITPERISEEESQFYETIFVDHLYLVVGDSNIDAIFTKLEKFSGTTCLSLGIRDDKFFEQLLENPLKLAIFGKIGRTSPSITVNLVYMLKKNVEMLPSLLAKKFKKVHVDYQNILYQLVSTTCVGHPEILTNEDLQQFVLATCIQHPSTLVDEPLQESILENFSKEDHDALINPLEDYIASLKAGSDVIPMLTNFLDKLKSSDKNGMTETPTSVPPALQII